MVNLRQVGMSRIGVDVVSAGFGLMSDWYLLMVCKRDTVKGQKGDPREVEVRAYIGRDRTRQDRTGQDRTRTTNQP